MEGERKPKPSDLITVCDKCLMSSCWQGIHMCQHSQAAGTVRKRRDELQALGLEHHSYMKTDRELCRA